MDPIAADPRYSTSTLSARDVDLDPGRGAEPSGSDRVISYAHDESSIGEYEKMLLHSEDEEATRP